LKRNRPLFIILFSFSRLKEAFIFSFKNLAFVANSRQISHPLCKDGNVEKQKLKREKLETLCENAKIQLTGSKEGKCERNQNDPNHSHVIFQGKSTLLKNCENFRMKTEL